MTIEQIYKAHKDYDEQFDDGYLYTLPDIIEGLAHLLRIGLIDIIEEDE